MTRRGSLTLLLGAATYVVAWLFGVKALYPAATGLVLAPLAATAWVRLAAGPLDLRRRAGKGALLEGEDVWVALDARQQTRVPAPSLEITERIAKLGDRSTSMSRRGRHYRGTYVLEAVPRGRYVVESVHATIDDPFGLARAELDLDARGSLLVYPRLVALDRLFSESGAHAQDGRRLLLRRPSGFDLHSVRDYERGESLRKVHWKTTARRGQLMVKELEDAPRDEIAVILDADAAAVAGESFDVQVRAAGSILRVHAAHGRQAVLAVNSAERPVARVASLEGDWLDAMSVLAAAEPDGPRPVLELLQRESGPASRAFETVVVTARMSGALATKLVQRALSGQGVSVVWIDSASFAGRPAPSDPELLRLQAAGVAVAVVRRGDSLAASSVPVALILLGWLRLVDPPAGGADWLWIVLLALAPSLAPTLWLRLALIPPAALTALWVAFDTPAPDDRRGFFEPVYDRFADGVLAYYDVTLPFPAPERPLMYGVLLLAVFGFSTLVAQSVAARRPLPAVLAVVAGAGWPGALYPADGVLYGAMVLAAALWLLAGMRASPSVPAFVGGGAVVLLAAAASTTSAVAKDGILDWEEWDPNAALRIPVSVSYVWDANYGGIEFAEKPTTVLRVTGPERGHYWRATTLDDFDADRWIESTAVLSAGPAQGRLPPDPLLPAAAENPRTWVRQDVEVLALNDTHVVGAAQPVRLEGEGLGEVVNLAGGLVRVAGLERGQSYTIWSYAPRPRADELARLGPDYPGELTRFLDLGRTRVEPFGTPGRDERVDALFDDERYLGLWPYREVWEQAKRLRADARTPYGAVVAIETWLRSTGGFRYDERPARGAGLPPLAHFVVDGKRGYCQHFAGAMALMLRMLGVPARVAAGFTSGERKDGGWTVTDHNAHAWVEAWFPGYGWLPFDPTPGRGSLTASYSASSTGFNVGDAAEAFGSGSGAGATGGGGVQQLQLLERERLLAQREAAQAAQRDEGRSAVWIVLLLAGGTVGAIALAKLVRRRVRYVTRDPRRIASAARHELADFLADQGIAVGRSATPEELRELVRLEYGRDAGPFAHALAEARFGPPEASRAAAARLRRELRTLLRSLRHGLGRTARLRGLVALRSLRA